MDLKGHTALVTGGAVRIGEAICLALAARKCNVVIHYDHSEAEAEALAASITRGGVKAFCVHGHFGDGDAGAILDRAWESAGKVDMLVNSAAVFRKSPLVGTTDEDVRSQLDINMLAPLLLSKRFAERLGSEKGKNSGRKAKAVEPAGRIVNVLDRRVSGVEAGCIPYLLSKKAMAEFTRSAALEWAPAITVNGVAPGAVLPPPGEGEDYLREAAGEIPLKTTLEPSDVADAVVYALSSNWMTGQILYVDGGQHLLGGSV
jgi:NAD(P)-dependent dehydrogenase (short-subunit alcohol dehydrogenase family)